LWGKKSKILKTRLVFVRTRKVFDEPLEFGEQCKLKRGLWAIH
jgi:hypothetical protein